MTQEKNDEAAIRLSSALDLLQLISEEIESNFFSGTVSDMVKSRAELTVSAMWVLSDFLRSIRDGLSR